MNLHIFNPEHDIALALNESVFTAPHSARRLRADLGFLPALYAKEGDLVLVDNKEAALESVRHLTDYAKRVEFVEQADLRQMSLDETSINVMPWGWDKAICAELVAMNKALEMVLPNEKQLDKIRQLSSREFAATEILPQLLELDEQLVGETIWFAGTHDIVERYFGLNHGHFVVKAPWSSSGRGVRYIRETLDPSNKGWIKNVLEQQKGLIIEPFYNKILDFGMEFYINDKGKAVYKGLSIFSTENRAYTGNLLTNEVTKREIVTRFVSVELLKKIQNKLVELFSNCFYRRYIGNLGVDMMIVTTKNANSFALHPCVEINLRNTMGHVALAISPNLFGPKKQMKIEFTDKYRLRVTKVGDDIINNSLIF